HGPAKMVSEALADVPLSPEQRSQIEQLASEAEVRHKAVQATHRDLLLAIADQVEKGAIDRAALQPKIDAATQAWQASRPQDRSAFERLHTILNPNQRSEFVDAMRTKYHSHKGKGHHEGGGHDRLAHWAEELGLTQDQKDRIRTALKEEHAKTDPRDGG